MTKHTRDILTIITAVVLIIVVLTVAPLLTIAAINALFSTGIAYSFWTWLSMLWIQSVTFGGIIGQLRTIGNKL